MKKNLTIIIITLTVISTFLLLTYFFISKSEKFTTITQNINQNLFPAQIIKNNPDQIKNSLDNSPKNESASDDLKLENPLKVISSEPVIDFDYKNQATTSLLVFVDRKGHVFEYNLNSEQDATPTKISQTTIYQPQKADFLLGLDKNLVVVRSTDGRSSLIPLYQTKDILSQRLINNFQKSKSLDSNLIITTQKDSSYIGFYKLNNKDFLSQELLYKTPFQSWITEVVGDDVITFTTKPDERLKGLSYWFNLKTKSLEKTLGPIAGLVTNVSPDKKYILYSNNKGDLNIYNKESRSTKTLTLKSIASKCLWANDSSQIFCAAPAKITTNLNYLNNWLKGQNITHDNLWLIDRESGKTYLMVDGLKYMFDITNLKLSPDENVLSFINKNNSSLWILRFVP
ncbi:MAG: hypothetical protein K8Q91_00585 [Candidatus Vogelbacteria bacterium]|nr:hypothetical protein [Candidatus Vogelbacteria bacterium]